MRIHFLTSFTGDESTFIDADSVSSTSTMPDLGIWNEPLYVFEGDTVNSTITHDFAGNAQNDFTEECFITLLANVDQRY